jgi:hypothetical protein
MNLTNWLTSSNKSQKRLNLSKVQHLRSTLWPFSATLWSIFRTTTKLWPSWRVFVRLEKSGQSNNLWCSWINCTTWLEFDSRREVTRLTKTTRHDKALSVNATVEVLIRGKPNSGKENTNSVKVLAAQEFQFVSFSTLTFCLTMHHSQMLRICGYSTERSSDTTTSLKT